MKILFSNYDADVDVLSSLKDILNKYYSSVTKYLPTYEKLTVSEKDKVLDEYKAYLLNLNELKTKMNKR